jgi:ABC-type transport system involved in multi-copper enzyme maturation permease subunit
MKITEELNQTHLSQYPFIMWFAGGFFFLLGCLFTVLAYGTFVSNHANKPATSWAVMVVVFGLSLVAILAGGLLIVSATVKKTTIDRTLKFIEFNETGLVTKKSERIAFADIREFTVLHETDSDDSDFYGIGMILKNSQEKRLSDLLAVTTTEKNRYEQLTQKLNQHLA